MIGEVFNSLRDRLRTIGIAVKSGLAKTQAQRALMMIVACIWMTGIVVRYEFATVTHRPQNYIIADARQYTDTAERLLEAPATQGIYDTVWPPGTPAVLAVLLARDGSLGNGGWLQMVLSSLLPLIVAHAAYLIGGRGVALLALGLSSLHFGLIYYTGFFMAEELFQFSIALAIWTSISVLILDDLLVNSPIGRLRKVLSRLGMGGAVGLSWALAASFRPNALPIALGAGLALSAFWVTGRRTESLWLLAGGLVGLTLLISPLAVRCSTLQHGEFCPISTNFAMNVALSQLDHSAGIEFLDPKDPSLNTAWRPPVLALHRYSGSIELPFSMYDTRSIWHWVAQQVLHNPSRAFVRVVRNVGDLFRFDYWPDVWPIKRWFVVASTTFIFALIVVPGFIGMLAACSSIRRRRRGAAVLVFFVSALSGVVLLAVITLGEPRYRFPFDGILIILSGLVLCGALARAYPEVGPGVARALRIAVGAVAALSGGIGLLIVVVSSPGSSGAAIFRPVEDRPPSQLAPDVRSATEFERPLAAHTSWDSANVYRFECANGCVELRLRFTDVRYSQALEVSMDNDDRYRILVYLRGQSIGHVDVPPNYDSPGLHVAEVELPAAAAGGFDALGIYPLYGDGVYVFGHLRVIP